MSIFLSWIALAIIIGVVATKRGRFGLGWFLLTLVASPIVTAPLVAVLPRRHCQTAGATEGGGAVLAAAKGIGRTVLIGGLILFALFAVALIAIVQHGGA